jgi:hypothetical protein
MNTFRVRLNKIKIVPSERIRNISYICADLKNQSFEILISEICLKKQTENTNQLKIGGTTKLQKCHF